MMRDRIPSFFLPRPILLARQLAQAACAAALLGLGACASGPGAGPAKDTARAGGDASADTGPATPAMSPIRPVGQDIATRHALFKVSAFDSLPGWQQDNMAEAWAAFEESCRALERKPNWKSLCAQVKSIKEPKAGRQFLEREFTLLTVQNTDKTREGDITGYYEPLLQGRAQRDARFSVPVYGVPNDLYFLDWKAVPVAQRKGVVQVRANGRLLSPVPSAQASQPGVTAVDMRRFTLDTLDRRLRVRLQGGEGLPYYTRADINRSGGLDAPVLAWVEDPIALYAMQVQGTGRIRMPDGTVLRMAYADQNGHPFKPMQLAASGNERVQTRGKAGGDGMADEVEHFDLADPDAPGDTPDEPLTRGGARKPATSSTTAAGASPLAPPVDPSVSAAVDSLLPPSGAAARTAVKAPVSGKNPAPAGSQQVLDDLLTQRGSAAPKTARTPASASPPTSMPTIVAAKPGTGAPANSALRQRSAALDSDPSYVFFRVAPDQSAQNGPVGALGVPLTAGRSLAVDPRVMPLGYPVFLDAAGGDKRQAQMRRLMFAQDTGGAIRGAVRADYFWGFGADAGKQARRTRNRGRMWVLVPHAEVEALLSSKLVTRGRGVAPNASTPECLVDDEAFCDAALPDEADPGP